VEPDETAGCNRGREIGLDLTGGAHDLTGSINIAALRNPARHSGDDAGIGFLNNPRQQICFDRHAQGSAE
jgi:hypothetical protein